MRLQYTYGHLVSILHEPVTRQHLLSQLTGSQACCGFTELSGGTCATCIILHVRLLRSLRCC
jgi:hypothetical protein